MTAEFVSAPQGAAITWTRRLWTRKPKVSVIQRPQAVESPTQGQGSTSSLLSRNQWGDSRAERENDSRI